eukprot:symbB.v1.2.038262.t2/scaffold5898.1/size44610/3
MPISTRFEGKAHGATGDAPIAVEEEHAEAAPSSWAGLWGGEISQDARPRVVVDAPNVARYFQGQRDAPTSQTVLQNALDELFRQVPRVQVVLVFSISSFLELGVQALRERYGRLIRLCACNGQDVDEVVLQEAASPGSRSCILSNDRFEDYFHRVSETWLLRFRVAFDMLPGSRIRFFPPVPYFHLSDFVSALPQQGHVLSTAQSSEDTGPVEATDVEAAMLQQAIEASQTSQVSQDDELERAIAASIEDALHSPMTGLQIA